MALTQVSTGGIKDGQVQTADLADSQITAAKLHADALDRTYTLGADGSNHYTFTGEGLTGAVNDPTLYLTRGKTYRFVNGNSAGAHPFRIQTTVNGSAGTEYNTGVTNNGGAGGSTIVFEVPHAAPDVLYYQCTSHGSMGGILYVTGALADGTVTTAKLAADAVDGTKIADDSINSEHYVDGSIDTAHIADQAVDLTKLPHGTSSNDGKFLRANNGADPTFETVNIPAGVGGATGVGFNDSVKVQLGTDNDLRLFYNGSDSFIQHHDATTGNDLRIESDTKTVFGSVGGAETHAVFNDDGAIELYYNNSKKVQTTDYGIDIIDTASPQTSASSSGRNLVISSGGAMGMTLHTDSTSSNCSILFSDPGGNAMGAVQYLHNNDQIRLYLNNNYSTPVMQFNSNLTIFFNGNMYSNGNSYSTGSDLRLKSNLVPFTNTLDKLKQIVGYQFDIKCGSDRSQTRKSAGVIAQDVEKVYPELVEEGPGGYKHLEYSAFTGILVEAVKELTTRVEALEAA